MFSKPKNEVTFSKGSKGKGDTKKWRISKNDLLFTTLIIITFFAGLAISLRSRQYVKLLREQNSNYYFPTLFDICLYTTILTFMILIPKVLIEKALYPFTEKILVEKYFKSEFKHEKEKAKRKMTIYGLKFVHYLLITIHSYYVYDKLEFFPKELFGHGDMNKLYYRGIKSFVFFERPALFDFHYLLNLAYTFADLICVLFIYDGQTDILVMIFHHFCTISLIVLSYYGHYDSIGCLILYLHNISDIIVYLGRSFLYIVAPEPIKKGITASLLISFIYCRLFVYGKLIYGYFLNANWESYGIIDAFKFLLICLYILHCTWTYKLIKIMYTALTKGKFSDSREFIKDKKKLN